MRLRFLCFAVSCALAGCPAQPGNDAGPDTASPDAPEAEDVGHGADAGEIDADIDAGMDAGAESDAAMADVPAPLGMDGDACEGPDDCAAGAGCNLQNTFGAPGYCVSFCADRPLLSSDAPIEQGSCAEGSVCVPLGGGTAGCLRRCDVDADCARTAEGYFCRHDFGTFHSDVGVCAQPHCRSRGGCEHAGCGC